MEKVFAPEWLSYFQNKLFPCSQPNDTPVNPCLDFEPISTEVFKQDIEYVSDDDNNFETVNEDFKYAEQDVWDINYEDIEVFESEIESEEDDEEEVDI